MDSTDIAIRNRLVVEQALGGLLTTGDTGALAGVLADDFVHRRPDRDRSKDEWLDSVREAMGQLADMTVDIHLLLAVGDHVVLHSRRSLPEGPAITVVDIWQLDAGRIVAGWEVIEPHAAAAVNFEWYRARARARA